MLPGVALLAVGVVSARAELLEGNITIYQGTTFLGYISDTYDIQDTFTYTANIANALNVQIDASTGTPFAILELNPPGANQYLGAVGGSGGYYFSSGNAGYAYLSGSALVPAGSTPSFSPDDIRFYDAPLESTIWSLSGNTITAQWVNVDNTVVSAQTFYDPNVNYGYIGITDDLSGYNSAYGEGAYAVTLDFMATPEPVSCGLIGVGLAAIAALRFAAPAHHKAVR